MRPGASHGMRASSPSPGLAAITSTGTPGATASISARRAATSSHRSALLSSTTGSGPALPGEDERALDPPRVEVPVEAHHEEDRVHVGGQHLGHRAVPGRAADEGGAPGQQGLDDRPLSRLARAQGHPVADRGQARRPAGLVAQAPRHGREGLTLLRVHAQDPGVAGDDAARHEAPGGEGREGLLEGAVEAELAESRPRQALSRAARGTRP